MLARIDKQEEKTEQKNCNANSKQMAQSYIFSLSLHTLLSLIFCDCFSFCVFCIRCSDHSSLFFASVWQIKAMVNSNCALSSSVSFGVLKNFIIDGVEETLGACNRYINVIRPQIDWQIQIVWLCVCVCVCVSVANNSLTLSPTK